MQQDSTPSPKVCPECAHVFQGNGWDGIDAHWRAHHESVMPYKEAWPLIKAGTYRALFIDLPYEIDQFREAFRELLNPQPKLVVRNALVDSVACRARCLIEFFSEKGSYSRKATEFTKSDYQLLARVRVDGLYGQISSQISHLQKRPTDSADKFNATDIKMARFLEGEIARFTEALKPDYRARFRCNTRPIDFVVLPAKVIATTSHSGSLTVITTDGVTGPHKPL
jgi:hypothetical protein